MGNKGTKKRTKGTDSSGGGGELNMKQYGDLYKQWEGVITALNLKKRKDGLTSAEKDRLRTAMENRDNIRDLLEQRFPRGREKRHVPLTSKIPSIRIQEGTAVYDITMDLVGVGARGNPTTVGTEMKSMGGEDPLAAVTEVICMMGHGSFGALTVETSSDKGEEKDVSRFTLTIDDKTPRGSRSSKTTPQNVGVVVSYEGGPGQSAFFELPKRSFLIKTTPYGSCGRKDRERDAEGMTLAVSQEMAKTIPRLFSRDGTDVFSTGLTEQQVQLESGGQKLNLGRGNMVGSRLPSNNSIPGDHVLNLEVEFFENGKGWAFFGLYGGKRLMAKAKQQSLIQAAVDAQHQEIGTSQYNVVQEGNDRPRKEFIKWFILKCVYKVRGAFYNSDTGQQFVPTGDVWSAFIDSDDEYPLIQGWTRNVSRGGPQIISEDWPPEPEEEEGKKAWIDKLLMPMVRTYNQQGQTSLWDPLLHRFHGEVWESVRGLLLDGGTGLERGEILLSDLMSWYAAGTQPGFAVWVPNICYPFDYTAKIGSKTYDVGQDDGMPVFLEGHEQLVNAVFEAFKVKLGALDEGNQAGFNMLLEQLGRREMSGLAPTRSRQSRDLVEAGADEDELHPLLMAAETEKQGGGRRRRRKKITRRKRSRGRTRKKKRRRVPRKRGRRKRTRRGRRKRRQKTRRHR